MAKSLDWDGPVTEVWSLGSHLQHLMGGASAMGGS